MKKLFLSIALSGLSASGFALDILSAHPIATGIASHLLAEPIAAQSVKLHSAVPNNLPATRQLNYLQGRGKEALTELSQASEIVLTVRSIFAQDYLYPFSRRHNIRIIPIDLATPIDGERAGVSKIEQEFLQHPVWFDPYNLSLMYSNLAREISSFEPNLKLEAALEQAQKSLISLRNDMEQFLSNLEQEPVALLLSPELAYFTQGLQISSVAASADADLATLIQAQGINLAISDSEPETALQEQLSAQGVKLLI
ncbi:hypothetical protein [Suttonella indologenes]|uniref:ABC-type Zn2+ transport system, periplasmic component/surface adhesin n=1 Tax=Suttonella indologenes TaxID=13276 RepID=A0A380MK32_9GAMM|nr:hypothetical protein [Suttonella indologenes]SUO92320.1 Uncharacterised protein [Suttonella indologenes]